MEIQAQMRWMHNTKKLKSIIVTSSVINISAWGFLGSFYLFFYFTKKPIPLHKQTDKSIQSKYSFSATVNFGKELVFGHNKCAKTLEAKYIAWLWKNSRLTGDIKKLFTWCILSLPMGSRGTCWEWDFPLFCSLSRWMIGLIWFNGALQHRYSSLLSWAASPYEGEYLCMVCWIEWGAVPSQSHHTQFSQGLGLSDQNSTVHLCLIS